LTALGGAHVTLKGSRRKSRCSGAELWSSR